MKRKQWLYSLIFVLLIGLTVFTICSQSASFTREGFGEYVRAAHPGGLAAAALCTLLYILLEGLALLTICRALGYRRGVGQGVLRIVAGEKDGVALRTERGNLTEYADLIAKVQRGSRLVHQ